jgi:parallel beta-helix repeat protein
VTRVQLNDLIVNTATGDPLTPTEGASVLVRKRGTTTAVTLYQASTGVSTWSQPIRTLAGNLQPAGTTGDIWVDEQQLDLAITPAGGGSITKRVEAATGAPAVESVLAWELVSASPQAAIENAIVALTGKPRAVVDFGGKTYVPTAAVNAATAGVTLQNGGIVPTANIVALNIQAADVTARNMVFGRGSGALTNDGLMARSTITVQAARYTQVDCNVTGSNHACVYIANGLGNGTRIEGGTFTNTTVRQNSCFVYAANGVLTNDDIIIDRITGSGGCSESILIFNANRCRITRNTLSGMTRPPTLTWTSGWTLLSGNVYSRTERTDGTTRIVKDGATELTEVFSVAPSTITLNQWIRDAGLVYVNVGGNPATGHTVTSDITGGYGPTIYSGTGVDDTPGTAPMFDNLIAWNHISGCDGFAVYLQMTADSDGNRVTGNTCRDVCQLGSLTTQLPYCGIAMSRGINTVIDRNVIDICGWHGIWTSQFATGRIVNNKIKACAKDGIFLASGDIDVLGNDIEDCTENGIQAFSQNNSSILLERINIQGNRVSGSDLGGIVLNNVNNLGGGGVKASVVNNVVKSCTQRGIYLRIATQSKVVGNTLHDNGAVSFQQIGLVGACDRCIVDDNTLTHSSSSAFGISVDDTATNCFVGKNTIGWTSGTPESYGNAVFRTSHRTWSCNATPEALITAPIGSLAVNRSGSTSTTLYVKTSGTGNTGWTAK